MILVVHRTFSHSYMQSLTCTDAKRCYFSLKHFTHPYIVQRMYTTSAASRTFYTVVPLLVRGQPHQCGKKCLPLLLGINKDHLSNMATIA